MAKIDRMAELSIALANTRTFFSQLSHCVGSLVESKRFRREAPSVGERHGAKAARPFATASDYIALDVQVSHLVDHHAAELKRSTKSVVFVEGSDAGNVDVCGFAGYGAE